MRGKKAKKIRRIVGGQEIASEREYGNKKVKIKKGKLFPVECKSEGRRYYKFMKNSIKNRRPDALEVYKHWSA